MCSPCVGLAGLQDGEAGVGGHGEGDVAVPAGISADLVVVQAAFLLGGLEAFLDRPPAARDADQFVEGGLGRAVGDAIGDLLRPADAAASDYPVPAVLAVPGPDLTPPRPFAEQDWRDRRVECLFAAADGKRRGLVTRRRNPALCALLSPGFQGPRTGFRGFCADLPGPPGRADPASRPHSVRRSGSGSGTPSFFR